MECIRFISHSCIYINVNGVALLCDPWFFGKVFNDSWDLLAPPDTTTIDYGSIRYVWISHEHPDHFNVPTLRFLKEKLKHDVTFIYRNQRNKNVVNFLRKAGYNTIELNQGQQQQLPELGTITSFEHRDDTALLIQTPETTIVNMNDCQLGRRACNKLKSMAGDVDILFYQFSLAGFSGDPSDSQALRGLQKMHLNRVREYFDAFKPRWFVPFASFIYFCTPYNRFMNGWRVSLDRVAASLPRCRTQIVYNGDKILTDAETIEARNDINRARWQEQIDGFTADLTERPPAEKDKLLEAADGLLSALRDWPAHSLPRALRLRIPDLSKDMLLDLRAGSVSLTPPNSTIEPVAELPSQSLLGLFETPWGADTLNISAESKVFDLYRWRWFLFCKQYLYKPLLNVRLGFYVPRLYAKLKPYL